MNRDYEVGYRKPPKASRWKPGQSGNPYGRGRAEVPHPTGPVDHEILAIGDEKVRVKQNGKEVAMPAHEAIRRSQRHQGASGNRLAAKAFIDDYDAAKAQVQQEIAARYAFWADWREQHKDAPLNWSLSAKGDPVLPHPRDILIDATTLAVTFVGPLYKEELALFATSVVLAEMLLIEAEFAERGGDEIAEAYALRDVALIVFRLSPPSLGGRAAGETERDVLHRFACLIMDAGSMTLNALTKRRSDFQAMFDGAVDDPGARRLRESNVALSRVAALARAKSLQSR